MEDGDDGKDDDGHACNASKPSRFDIACMEGMLSRLGLGETQSVVEIVSDKPRKLYACG